MAVQLKICGVTRKEDILACRDAGVDAVGLNFWSGSKRGLTLDKAESLVADFDWADTKMPKRIGVFVDDDPEFVRQAVERAGLDAIQPHGDLAIERYSQLGIPYVWVIRGTPSLVDLELPVPAPQWILLDAAVQGYGGVGAKTDWQWAAQAVRHFPGVPVWLAGGITHKNAQAALEQVRPAGLDVASGAELSVSPRGEKDTQKIRAIAALCHGHDS